MSGKQKLGIALNAASFPVKLICGEEGGERRGRRRERTRKRE